MVAIKVLTFNIHHCRGKDGEVNIERVSEMIKSINADIIGLNEVDKNFSKRSDFLDQAEWIAKKLGLAHLYAPGISKEDGSREFGNALLTRFPVTQHRTITFSFLPGIEKRSMVEACLDTPLGKVMVYVSHLSLNPVIHFIQTGKIIGEMNRKYPVILMGDWNMRPKSRGWKMVTAHLTDTWDYTASRGKTFPSIKPRVKLDYIFCSQQFSPVSSQVIASAPIVSDHLPLVSILSKKD